MKPFIIRPKKGPKRFHNVTVIDKFRSGDNKKCYLCHQGSELFSLTVDEVVHDYEFVALTKVK